MYICTATDNTQFNLYVLTEIRFLCMGTWTDDTGKVWSAVSDIGKDVYREKFRCMVSSGASSWAISISTIITV